MAKGLWVYCSSPKFSKTVPSYAFTFSPLQFSGPFPSLSSFPHLFSPPPPVFSNFIHNVNPSLTYKLSPVVLFAAVMHAYNKLNSSMQFFSFFSFIIIIIISIVIIIISNY